MTAATVTLFDGDKKGPAGIVTGRNRKTLLAKAKNWAKAIATLGGFDWPEMEIVADTGEDLSEEV